MLIGTSLLAPSAAADSISRKDVCDADAPAIGEPVETGVQCVTGTLETHVSCPNSSTYCYVYAQTSIEVNAPLGCGSVRSNATHDWSDTSDRTGVCAAQFPYQDDDTTGSMLVEKIPKSSIPAEGKDLWYHLEVCTGTTKLSNIHNGYCPVYKHHEWIPPQGDGLASPVPFAEGVVDHAQNVAEDANPVSVSTN